MVNTTNDTITAIASGIGGAITLIRVSGPQAIAMGNALFCPAQGKGLADSKGFTLHYGTICEQERVIDDVLISLFRAPHSYTGEDMLEISCHASPYIQQEILRLLIAAGARMATPGEFTLRAFLAGKMDLSQAEAVADVIAADSRASHALASQQIRGGYSAEFRVVRDKLIELASLLELELDFSEEEVEFADRTKLKALLETIEGRIQTLIDSFRLGNVLKNGIPVAIVGIPNVGKSTLLNALLHEEKALVSEIAGTTRDVIEDTLNIGGVNFRFIDTAGIRHTTDPLEHLGIERTFDRITKASIILLLTDARDTPEAIYAQYASMSIRSDQQLALILNKSDYLTPEELARKRKFLTDKIMHPILILSAKQQQNLTQLTDFLQHYLQQTAPQNETQIIVFNSRHHEILRHAHSALQRAHTGLMTQLSSDLLAQDVREIIHYISMITGEITTDDILGSIFSKFCIGK